VPSRTVSGRPTPSAQHQSGRNEVLIKLWHMVLPWGAWIGLTLTGLVLKLFLLIESGFWFRAGTVLTVLALGTAVTGFDLHLRWHRAAVVGRLIGPVTAALAALALAAFLIFGFGRVLAMAYFLGGLCACVIWDLWLSAGDNRDLAKAFAAKAEPVGMQGARLFSVRHRRAGSPAGGQRAVVTEAGLQLPDGMVVGEAAEDIERVEAALRHPPGSWTVTSDLGDAGVGNVKITDPQVLLRGPVPWPGPSAPGESIADAPFRLGLRQDSDLFLYRLLPSHSVKVMGQSGSAKSMGYAWNMIAEGVTRRDYAVVAADVAKRRQFLGALEAAMALPLAVEPEDAVELLYALKRARLARCDYLAKRKMTEWERGCGLSYLHALFEETPDILALLDRKQLEDLWVSLQRNVRSAGIRADSSQQSVHHSQGPTVARAQQGHVCFGVADAGQAELGLSETQRQRGARPQLWGASYPGMSVWDTLTIPDADKALPVRLYSWGDGAQAIFEHVQQYAQDRDREVDGCTMDALLAKPGPSPTSTDRPVGGRYDKAGAPPPAAKPAPAQAIALVRDLLWALRDDPARPRNAAGQAEVTARDLNESGVCQRAGRSRSWLYGPEGAMAVLEDRGVVQYLGDAPVKHWAVCEAPPPAAGQDEDPRDEPGEEA